VSANLRIPSPGSYIYLLLTVFVVVCVLYSVVVPPFEASDELWHFPMAQYIADHWSLPVQDPENVGPWRQEGSQPPLYYLVGAVATAWIDTSDVDLVRHLNPHADNGIATPDGNINLITHHPEAESFPWQGTTLAVHLIRLLSVLMGAATVYLTYRLALELAPRRLDLALGAAAINAFTPMFIFISAAVNNDNLVILLSSLTLLLMVRIVKIANHAARGASDLSQITSLESRLRFYVSRFTLLGLVVGSALLTKESAGGLIFLTILTVAYVAWREHSFKLILIGGLLTGGSTLLVAGWWYWRNWQLYGDPLGQNVFIEILGQRDVPADLAQLWRERISFIRGYWGNFGGLNVLMPEWVYTLFNVFLVVAAIGLLLPLLGRGWSLIRVRLDSRDTASQRYQPGDPRDRRFVPWLLVLLWPALVVILWITWATTTWSSQGRLVFSAISVWSFLLALGWHNLTRIPPRRLRSLAFFTVPLIMLAISLLAPFAWIRPAYARPTPLADQGVPAIAQEVDAIFFHPSGGQLKLLGYDAPVQAAYPGEQVPVTLFWEAIAPFNQDFSIFLHLVDAHDLVIAQRDALPGMGTLSTQWLTPGQRWAEWRVLTLPETAFSPNHAVFEVGLYDYHTGERLALVDANGQITGDNVRFGELGVQARPGEVPNPIEIDFGGEMELIGYDLDRRALRPGEGAALTLYWRGQRPMETNYSISTQFVDRHGVKAAQKDAWPHDGVTPTSLWEPGSVIEESRQLVVFDDAPPGVYDVYVAVYPSDDPDSLLVVTPSGGRLQTDHVTLTQVRVLP
jgi:4-amino-4-deoxy-L-arabinose transferase-like glycosyltransferase